MVRAMILDSMQGSNSAYVFPGSILGGEVEGHLSRHTPDHKYADIARRLGMTEADGKPNTGVHDLRRTMATNVARLGVSTELIDRLQGRKVGSGVSGTYNRYAYEKEKSEALAKWESELLRIVS